MGHRRGQDRGQATLFPLMLDELEGQDALVRVVDAWVQALERLKAEGRAIANEAQQLMRSGASTIVSGEPAARPMRSLDSWPGYNLQTAVEMQSHLIVTHEVVCETSAQRQLQPMAEAASRALEQPWTLKVSPATWRSTVR
ncbi:hypothetical protein SAMN05518800_6790 [Variovorax sp. YR752]|uniref:hypothetical protein n=1 Tax=Variovorax sp. YR752 TaxID=1884383 RepID=UPI000BD7D8E2|nr:hypothetical protein [Variovorax sp. YR752]SOE06165.1 hypothetical protein SAMN05518800_6790 [Variovorax sp. YR752]